MRRKFIGESSDPPASSISRQCHRDFQADIQFALHSRRQASQRLNDGVGVDGHEHQAGNDAVADDSGCAAIWSAGVDEETGWVAGHREVARHLGDDQGVYQRRVGIRLHNHSGAFLPAKAGRMREADEHDVATFH